MANQRIVIISPRQFGYWSDYYYWALYLKNKFEIYYLCQYDGLPIIKEDLINVIYLKKYNYKRFDRILFILSVIKILIFKKGVMVVNYFEYCSLLRLFMPWKKIVLDVRTGAILENPFIRKKQNMKLRVESSLFKHITIISYELGEYLRLPRSKLFEIPVGGNMLEGRKSFSSARLLYIGVLDKRNICETLKGLYIALNVYNLGNYIKKYTIVGYGEDKEVKKILDCIKSYNLDNLVSFVGRVPVKHAIKFLKESNVGVSFVPKKCFYQHQPPTKTVEYILSGSFVIATDTAANRKIVNCLNGYLIDDTAYSFAKALYKLFINRENLNSDIIKCSLKEHDWKYIVYFKLYPYLFSLI